MIVATRGGDGWLWYALTALVLAFGGTERYAAVCAAWTACSGGAIAFLILKKIDGKKAAKHAGAALLGHAAAA